jgi:hypothetical protein
MGVIEALSIGISLTNAGLELLTKANVVSQLVNKAQNEGRDTLTQEEWNSVIKMDDDARNKLQAAIEASGG